MPTYLKYEYIFSSFRFKVGSGSAFFSQPDPDPHFFPSRIWIRGKKMSDPHPCLWVLGQGGLGRAWLLGLMKKERQGSTRKRNNQVIILNKWL